MAETTIPVPAFDLGIQGSETYGNIQDAEAFLSGESLGENPDDLEEVEEEPKKAEPKKEVKKIELTAEDVLGEETKPKTIKDALEEDPEEDPEGNQLESLSSELYKIGFFTSDEEGDPVLPKTPEELLEKLNEEKQRGASAWLEGYLGRFGEDRREMFEAVFVNGVDHKDYIPVFNKVQDLEGLDLTLESNQELVVRSHYKSSGFTDAQIENKITKLKSFADLEDESKILHPILVAKDKQKLSEMSENAAKEREAIQTADLEYKNSITKILRDKLVDKNVDGIPLSEKTASEAFKFLYEKKWKTKSGELLTDLDKFILETKNPDNHLQRVKLALLAMNKFDFSKIEKKALSKESSSLFSTLVSKKTKSNTQPATKGWANL